MNIMYDIYGKIIINLILLIIFSIINYFILVKYEKQDLRLNDVIYFTFITHFTVGYGEIVPKSDIGRGFTMLYISLIWIVNLIPYNLIPNILPLNLSVKLKQGLNSVLTNNGKGYIKSTKLHPI